MSDPWPAREPYEEDHRYLIRMVRQLFVEIAEIQAKLDKPVYQITMPPGVTGFYFGIPESSVTPGTMPRSAFDRIEDDPPSQDDSNV